MSKHYWYYLSLLLILLGGFLLIAKNGGNRQMQTEIVVMLGILYVVWGVLHHLLHHSIRVKIVLEYICFAMLGTALVLFVLQGGL